VITSNCANIPNASALLAPQLSMAAAKRRHTSGLTAWPNILQRFSSSSWTQRIPAGLPCGMPGIGELMEGAMQQAPQPGRHSIR